MEFPDSDNFTVVHSGKLNVKANTEASRRFLSTAKKAEWKLRYAEIVIYTSIDGVDRYYILIYKLKKGDVKVPYLKLDINKDTEIQSFDLFGKFFFDLPSDHSASFSTEFSIDRDEWVQVIESCVSASRDGNSTKISPRKSFRADVPTKVTNTTTMSSQIANSNQEKSRSYNIPDDPTTPDSFVLAQNTTISSGNGYSESSTMSHMNDPHLSLISKTDSPVKSNEHSSVDKSNVRFFGSIDIKDGDGDDSSQGDTSSLSIGLKRPSINKNLSLHEQIGGLSTVPLRKSERKAHPDSVSRQIKNKGTVPLSLGSPQNETFGSTIDGQGLEISVCRSIADSSDIPTYPSTSDGIATSFSPPGQYNRRANAGLTPHRADQYDRSFTFDTAPSSGQYHPESMLMREIQALAAMNNELNDALEASVTERNEEREEFLKQITTLQTALEEAAVEKQVLLEKQNSYQNSIDVLNVSVSNTTELSQQLAESSELVDALRDRIRSFEGLESEIKFQAEEVSQLKNENSRLSEQCTTKDSTIAEQHEQIDAVEQSLDEMRKLLSKQDKQIATLSESEQQLREESEKYLAEVKELRDAIASNEWKLRADELALKFTNSENERQQATMELLAVKQTEESSRMSMVRLENLTKEQQSFIEDLNKQINALNDAKVQLADTHSQLILRSTELANAKKEIENLKGDLVGINALLFSTEERLKQEQEQRASDSAASSRELESTKLKLKQTEKDFINLNSEIEVLQRRIEFHREQSATQEKEMLESYRNHALELQSYNKQKQLAEDSLEASNKATKELQARCQSLQELHQNEILEYKKKVKDLEEIINILKDTNENQSSRLLEQESQMNKLRQRLNEEKGVANSKNDKLEKLEQQYEKELLNKKNVITSLETKIRTIEEMMSSAQQELALSETRRREDEEKNSLMYKEISISLSTAEKSNRQLREQLNNLTSEKANAKEAFEERIEDLIQSNENYQLKTFELERKISSLETNSNINFQKFSKTEMDLQAKILNLMSSNDSLKSELSALKQAKDDLSDKAIDLENQLNLLTEEKDNLESEYAEKVSEYDSLSEEYHAVKMELNKEVKNLSAEVKDLKQANNALSADHKKHSDELHQEKIHMQSVIDKLTTDCESLNQTIESYREQINYNNNEIASLSLKISKQDKELTCKNLVINKNNELIKQLNEEIEAISTEKNHLQDQFADIQGASIVMKVKLSENENVINRQRNENKRLTDELMDRTEQLKASKTTIVDLQDDIDGLRLKKEELETELDSYKTFAETSSGKLKLSEKNVTYLEKELVVKLKQTIKHLEDKCQDSEEKYTADTEHLQELLEQRTAELEQCHTQIKIFEKETDAMSETIASLEQKMSNMTSTVEAENQFSNMQTKLKGEIDKLELQIQQQNSKIESLSNLSTITETDLKRQLVLLSEKNENCERQRDSYYSELLSVKNDNTSMTNQLSELNYLLTNKDNESKKTYELIKTLREQLDQLRLSSQSDLDALRSTNSSLMIENDNCKYQIGSLQKEIEKFKLFVTNMIQSTARELTLENITVSVEDLDTLCTHLEKYINALSNAMVILLSAANSQNHTLIAHQDSINNSNNLSDSQNSTISSSNNHSLMENNDKTVTMLSIRELINSNKLLISEIIRRERETTRALSMTQDDHQQELQSLTTIQEELEKKLKMQEEQMKLLKQSKIQLEQKLLHDTNSLEEEVNRLVGEQDAMQDEHAKTIARLVRTQEEKLNQQEAYLRAQYDQKIAYLEDNFKKEQEDINGQTVKAERTLKGEIDYRRKELEKSQAQLDSVSDRLDDLQKNHLGLEIKYKSAMEELREKNFQLEQVSSQLEKAEMYLAKESRQKLDLERTLRKFRGGTPSVSVTNTPLSLPSATATPAASGYKPTIRQEFTTPATVASGQSFAGDYFRQDRYMHSGELNGSINGMLDRVAPVSATAASNKPSISDSARRLSERRPPVVNRPLTATDRFRASGLSSIPVRPVEEEKDSALSLEQLATNDLSSFDSVKFRFSGRSQSQPRERKTTVHDFDDSDTDISRHSERVNSATEKIEKAIKARGWKLQN